jgi:sugar phosphate isomerase/epimerase
MRLGFRDLEVMLQTQTEYASAFLADLHHRADAAGISIYSYHLFQRLHPLYTGYQRRTAEALDLMRQAFASAADHGVRYLVWHGAAREEVGGIDAWNRFLMMAGQVGAMAAEYAVTVVIENVSWCVVSSVRDVQRLAAAIPNLAPAGSLGFTFDSFQALEAEANAFMILAAMGSHLCNVHLSDGRLNDAAQRHLLPGDGEIPWSALIRAIGATGYRGPMMLEAPVQDLATLARARDLLEPLIAVANGPSDTFPQRLPAGVLEGIRLFNAGEYYECHEVIEHEWHAERGEIRRLYQGILQIGVGLHHIRSGNQRGADLLLTDGLAKVSEFLPTALGLDTAGLVAGAQACLDEVRRVGPDGIAQFDWSLVPVIKVS